MIYAAAREQGVHLYYVSRQFAEKNLQMFQFVDTYV